jgi:hypothetical protein
MTIIACIVVLICMILTNGCSCGVKPTTITGPQTQAASFSADLMPEKEDRQLLEVEQFSLTKDNLRLNYRVTNTLSHEIWVCTSLSPFTSEDDPWSVETRIADRTLLIMRRGNMKQNLLVDEGAVYAGYQRLPPGRSRLGTVLLALPVRNISCVYEPHEPFSRVVLNRVVLELGYFGGELPDLLSENNKRARLDDSDVVLVRYVKPNKWEGLAREQSMQVTIQDVAIPGVFGGHSERLEHGIAPP